MPIEIAPVIIALFLIIIAFAAYYLLHAISQVVAHAPVIGGWVSREFDNFANDVRHWADTLLHGLDQAWVVIFAVLQRDFYEWAGAIEWLFGIAHAGEQWIAHTLIPDVVVGIEGGIADLAHGIDRTLAQVQALVRELIATAEADVIVTLKGWTRDLVDPLISKVESEVLGIVTQDIPAIGHELAHDEAIVADGFSGVWSELNKVVGQVDNSLPLEIAALGTAVATISKWIERCGQPTCDQVNQWESGITNLLGLADAGAIASFLSQAIDQPAATADAIARLAGGWWSGAQSTLATILSI